VLPHALRLIKPGMRHDRRPLKPIFRDEDELVPGQDLPERIRRGLENSEFLIVVCSPRAVASEWVGKEIKDFIALGRGDSILAVVVDGEPNTEGRGLAPELECLPRELRFQPELRKDGTGNTTVNISDERAEPLWLDWRKTNRHNRPTFLRLVAALLSLSSLDELVRKDQKYRRRRAALLWSVTGVAVCCILGLVIGLRIRENQAVSRQLAAEALQDFETDPVLALRKVTEAGERSKTEEAYIALNDVLEAPRERFILHHKGSVGKAVYSPDGERIVTASRDNTARIWDAESGRLLATLSGPNLVTLAGHTDAVNAAMFSPDGKRIVTASDDDTARIWDAESHRLLATLSGHIAAFSPDVRRIVTASADWTAKVYSDDFDELLKRAKQELPVDSGN